MGKQTALKERGQKPLKSKYAQKLEERRQSAREEHAPSAETGYRPSPGTTIEEGRVTRAEPFENYVFVATGTETVHVRKDLFAEADLPYVRLQTRVVCEVSTIASHSHSRSGRRDATKVISVG